MKKLDIHRDVPEPSLEEMKKHMNFEEVLKRSSAASSVTKQGVNKSWLIGGIATVTFIIATFIYIDQSSDHKPSYKNLSMETAPIEKIEPIEANPKMINSADTTAHETQEETQSANEELAYNDHYPTPVVEVSEVDYYEPKLVSSIPFKFDESFGMRGQWQAFEELAIYENLSFQPIDKAQQAMLKLTWDKADLEKDKNGQYYLILYKGDQGVICPVIPVFEKDYFVEALNIYKSHQQN